MDKFRMGLLWVSVVALIVIGILMLIQGNIFGLVLIFMGGITGLIRLKGKGNERKRT